MLGILEAKLGAIVIYKSSLLRETRDSLTANQWLFILSKLTVVNFRGFNLLVNLAVANLELLSNPILSYMPSAT